MGVGRAGRTRKPACFLRNRVQVCRRMCFDIPVSTDTLVRHLGGRHMKCPECKKDAVPSISGPYDVTYPPMRYVVFVCPHCETVLNGSPLPPERQKAA